MTNQIEQHRAAAALSRMLAEPNGQAWADKLADYYRTLYPTTEQRLARMLADLRATGVDVRGAMQIAERQIREVEVEVPVR